jgi:tetratricopeptide (TPR) repeat protein
MEGQDSSCPVCEKEVEAGSRFCEACGIPLKGEGPDDSNYLEQQVARLILMDSRKKALERAQALVERNIGSCQFLHEIGNYCLKYKDGQGAIFWLDKALERQSSPIDRLEIHQKKGNILKSWGYLDQAEYELKLALHELDLGRKSPPPPPIEISAFNLVMDLVDGINIDTKAYWKDYFKNKQEVIQGSIFDIASNKAGAIQGNITNLMSVGKYEEAMRELMSLNTYIEQNRWYVSGSNEKAQKEQGKWIKQMEKQLKTHLEQSGSARTA